jgi:flagellar motility protein MotE (MotC chaperone)
LKGNSINTDKPTNNTFTQSEIQILQELAERREALELRSQEIDKRAVQLKVSEQEIAKRLKQMQDYEQKLKSLIQEYNEKERSKITSLVKVYTSMKPKDAARIFDTLDLDVTVALLKEMKPSLSSAIIAQMPPAKAKAITDKIIGNAF